MKKEIGTLMLLSVVLLLGCGSDKPATLTQGSGESPSKQVTTQPEPGTDAKLIETSENEKVKLYAIKEVGNVTEGIKLDINGNKKDFDWEVPDTGTKPQVFYTDLTGDSKEEAVIIIQTGRGTGLDNYDIHVINAENLSEIKIQSYDDIVAEQIETHVAKNGDGSLAITVKTQGKEYKFDYGSDPAPDYSQDELAFGGVVIYALENQKIILNIPGSVGVSPTYVCDFNVTYKFDSVKKEFIVDQIEVEPIEK
ncbi:hypothetical protein [Paenibacillus xylanivorans]|uniref:Uncharacterized protein n=1 Tax=Paenibacillus xylanivorans TaxID=1705561 RepID=A0A0M9BIJ3_9BACL|nr:hypothetical protein [Paenibacillus xylanivorans]KOY13050.1 hypothetical protein AMS66_28935 [Paenibacillus xylanivorans]